MRVTIRPLYVTTIRQMVYVWRVELGDRTPLRTIIVALFATIIDLVRRVVPALKALSRRASRALCFHTTARICKDGRRAQGPQTSAILTPAQRCCRLAQSNKSSLKQMTCDSQGFATL